MDNYFKSIGLNREYESYLIPCEVCNGRDFTVVLNKARVGGSGVYGELPVRGCKKCGYIMINPRYEKQFYLDLSCSAGGTMIPFLEAGWETVSIEPDEASVEAGKKRLGLDIRLGEAESIDFSEGTFDLVLCLGTIGHCYDLDTSMLAVKRALKERGIFFVRNRSDEIFGLVIEYFSNNHYRYFTKKTFELLMIRYGFKIKEFQDRPLEEIPAEFYAVASSEYPVSLESVHKKIISGLKDDIPERQRYFISQQHKFVEKSKYLLKLAEEMKYDYVLLAQELLSGRHELTISVEGAAVDAAKRAVVEARAALENPIEGFLG